MPIRLHSALVQNCLFLSRDSGQRIVSRDRELQESIPVGCVPSAAVAVGGGVSAQGVYPEGVSAPMHVGIHPPPVCLGGGAVFPSACSDTHPPSCGQNDRHL